MRKTQLNLADFESLAGFHEVKPGEYRACCPGHNSDTDTTLSIDDTGDKLLVHCFVGCTYDQIIGALSVTPRNNPTKKSTKKRKLIATYDYVDEGGVLLFQKLRYEPKDFRQKAANGTWSLKGVRRVLYHLPAVLAADAVYVVEGEKDADRLNGCGFAATCNFDGAGKWLPEYNDCFKDKNVFIIPDNDKPGKAHANHIASELSGIATSVKVLDLGGKPSADVSDWLDDGHTADELTKIADTTAVYKAPLKPFTDYQSAVNAVADTDPGIDLLNLAALCVDLSDAEWDQIKDAIDKKMPGKKTVLDSIRNNAKQAKNAAAAKKAAAQQASNNSVLPSVEIAQLLANAGYKFAIDDTCDGVLVNGKEMNTIKHAEITTYVQDRTEYGERRIENAVLVEAAKDRFHPMKRYFENLPAWDGADHLETILGSMHLSNEIERDITRAWFIGAIDKIFTQEQNFCLIVDGQQGIGKSTLMHDITPKNWFIEGFLRPDNKDHLLRTTRAFIWEIGEIQGVIKKADREALKNFLTLRDVQVRPPYGRSDIRKPISCSFVGTVNNTDNGLFSDPTGNRRFVVVRSTVAKGKRFDDAWMRVDVDQLWSQLYTAYANGERGKLTDDERRYRDDVNSELQMTVTAVDLFEEYFVVSNAIDQPVEPEDDNGGVMNGTQIMMLLQTYCGLRGSQDLNKIKLNEHLLFVTGCNSRAHRNANGEVKKGYKNVWMRENLCLLIRAENEKQAKMRI